MTNKEKFLALVSEDTNNTLDYLKDRVEKRAQLRESNRIAWKVIDRLETLGWTQKMLAEKMNVSPQQVNKIVKGQENLTLSTQVKLQEILNVPILATFYENALEKFVVFLQNTLSQKYTKPEAKIISMSEYKQSVSTKTHHAQVSEPQESYEIYNLQA